jgi:hypothetical protein
MITTSCLQAGSRIGTASVSTPTTIRFMVDFQFNSSTATAAEQTSLRAVVENAVLVLQKFIKVGAGGGWLAGGCRCLAAWLDGWMARWLDGWMAGWDWRWRWGGGG